jgi:trk system potassium uptake protein TrkA
MRVLILGAGEVGRHLARSLSSDANVVLLDADPHALAVAEEELDVLVMEGNATHRDALEGAEVREADLVISVAGEDSVNVAASVLAKNLGARRAVARVDDPGFYRGALGVERDVAGIDACVCASRLVGVDLLRLVNRVEVGWTSTFVGGAVHVGVIELGDDSPVAGGPVGSLGTEAASITRAVLRGDSIRLPSEVASLEAGDRVILAGPPVGVASVARGMRASGSNRVVLVGGGDVGLQLARALSALTREVSIVEESRERCETLASILDKTTILHGNGTNLAFLREEQIGRAETALAVTGSDEVNLMSSLLSNELGVEHTFALVHRPGYSSVYAHLGIDGTTSAHEVLSNTLQWLLPGRTVVSSATLPDSDWSILELRVPHHLPRQLRVRDLSLGASTRILGVLPHSDPTIAPEANPVLSGGEHLLVACPIRDRRSAERGVTRLETKNG